MGGFMKSLAAALIVLAFLCGAAQAQDGPMGIAFVQAPEQGAGTCIANNPDRGFACAKEKCVAAGAPASECLRVQWCYPHMWAADVFVQNQEGVHWHEYLCGWDSRETLEAAVAVKCDRTLRAYLLECSVVEMWSDLGEAVALEGGQ
jgi:hypothetical protein